ncbi:MAG: MFS transporter [Planctomycetota bacterium]
MSRSHSRAPGINPSDLPLTNGQAESASLRRDLRKITFAWSLGCVWLWIASGAVINRFAVEVGTPGWAFGLLAGLPFIAALSQLPVTWYLSRHRGRRRLFLWCCTTGRVLFIVVGLVPWVLPQDGVMPWWIAAVFTLLIAHALNNATGPAWLNWMSDLIPRRVRGRYFARREQVVTPVAIVASLGAALLLDVADQHTSADAMLVVTSLLLIVAGVFGAGDILVFLAVRDDKEPDPQTPDPDPATHTDDSTGLRSMLRPLRDPGFRCFLGFNFALTLAIGFIGQYLWLYLLDNLSWSNLQANALVLAIPMFGHMFVRPAWGRACDRLGKRPTLIISSGCICFGAVGWMAMTPTLWWPGYLLVFLVTLAWPGLNLANLNFLLDFSKSATQSRQDERGAGAPAAALFAVCIAVSGGLSGLIGGSIAGLLEARSYTPLPESAPGLTLNYFHALFLVSTLIRFVALAFALRLDEPKAAGTRDAIRYMTTGLYSNLRGAALTPTRWAAPARRWAYRIDRRRPR